jgi:ribosome recycling factor
MNSLKRDSQEGTFSDDEQKRESSAIQQLTDEKTNFIDDLSKSKTTDIKQV